MAERIRARQVADIVGVNIRSVQSMAIRGESPSAARFGKIWTFSEKAVRAWVAEKEQETSAKAKWSARVISDLKQRYGHHKVDRQPNYSEVYERLMYPKGRDNPIYHRRRRKKVP
jgi:hypothetical protein